MAMTMSPHPTGLALTPRPVVSSLDELLAGVTSREPYLTTDSKSGNAFERVVIDGERLIVKYVHVDEDFTIRGLGDLGPRPLFVWRAGLMDLAPDLIDHGVVGVAGGLGRNGWGAAILMRDLSAELVASGDQPLSMEEHLALLDHCAGLSARAWGWRDDIGLLPYGTRWHFFGPGMIEAERQLGFPTAVPPIAAEGWVRFAGRAPADVADAITAIRNDPTPLVRALSDTPSTFLHGDWKLGNLGHATDGRTVLIDWSYPGEGPACHELAWYLALNAARLPQTREASIEAFRSALERHGVATDAWWDRQLALCLLGAVVQFGWEKAFGDDRELHWWCDRARDGVAEL